MPGRVLLLQGPVGPFFSRLAAELRAEGHEVFKIHFNGGDELFYRQPGAHRFAGRVRDWPEYLSRFIRRHAIDRIFLFGDCRPLHVAAGEVARRMGVAVFVFEEGYVRPDYITFEPGGVNGHSALSREPGDYAEPPPLQAEPARPTGSSFWLAARYAICYYLASFLLRPRYPYYRHHRSLNPVAEGLRWVRAGARKLYHSVRDRRLQTRLRLRRKQFFLVPLQVHCDAQVTRHSHYDSIEQFIAEVIGSFAAHAPADTGLVFKHHPMDRGYTDYRRTIGELATRYGVRGRVRYLREGHLPALLRNARAAVMINSTVGLSALLHRTPVKVMGYAVYDMPGLTCQRPLDAFWREPGDVDLKLYKRFRQYLVANVLANGNFYRAVRADRGATGVAWPFGSISAASDPARAAVLPVAGNVVAWPTAAPALAEDPALDETADKALPGAGVA